MDDRYLEQKKTLDDLLRKLEAHHKCAVIRPPGFGKTCMLTDLIGHYGRVLYLYPSTVVKDAVVNRYYGTRYVTDHSDDEAGDVDAETIETIAAMGSIGNCTLMTYAKLARMCPEELHGMGYDLIVFDEVHRIGGTRTRISVEHLFAGNPNAYFVGATATPNRMDGFDVVSVFFSDIMTYVYTIHDAIRDGILQKPDYCYCTHDAESNVDGDLRAECLMAGEDPDDPVVRSVMGIRRIELAKLLGMPHVIRTTCEACVRDVDYMKFIVFFGSIAHMDEKLPEVSSWFHEAYPGHALRTLRISSKNGQESSNTDVLPKLSRAPATIDLIGCVDMLNLGYHVPDQTGIVMYRGTKSSTIFIQHLGRALSAGTKDSCVVFDVVDNLHRKAVYEMTEKLRPVRTGKDGSRQKYVLDDDGRGVVIVDGGERRHPTQYHMEPRGDIVDSWGNKSTLAHDAETGAITDCSRVDKSCMSRVTEDCVNLTGHMATYREIMAKAMAEPLSYRCRDALVLHFRTWCRNHGIRYPISDAGMKSMYGLSKRDFYDEFCCMLRNDGIRYPLQDAAALLRIGASGDTDVPLSICAQAKNVSVRQILDMLGIE